MFATRASRRVAISYAILLAISLLLLAVSGSPPITELRRGVGFAMSPIQGALSGGTRAFTSLFDALAEIEQLRRSNQELQEQIQALQVLNRQLESVRMQNEQLTELLGVQSALTYQTVAAEVIGREISPNERGVTLNQGADRGITEGDVVVAEGGALVGRVMEAGPNYSRVLLISDTRSTVVGLVESSRATGDVQGQASASLAMNRIPSTDEVAVGETVVTAGIDLGNGVRSPFPRGLIIGDIVAVQRDPNAVVQTAVVQPAAPIDKLEYVLVITDYEGGLSLVPDASPGASPDAGTDRGDADDTGTEEVSPTPSASSTDEVDTAGPAP